MYNIAKNEGGYIFARGVKIINVRKYLILIFAFTERVVI